MAAAVAAANARRMNAEKRAVEKEQQEALDREAEEAKAALADKEGALSMSDLLKAAKLKKKQAGGGFALKETPRGLDALLADPPSSEVIGPSGRLYHSTSLFCLWPVSHQPVAYTLPFACWLPSKIT